MQIRPPVDPRELDRRLVHLGGLHEFVRLAWPLVEAEREFLDNWHIRLVCAHLEAVSRGEIKRLLINIPPGCMKSRLVGVFWPAWDWIYNGGRKWMNTSYDAFLTRRDAVDSRAIISSKWFQERWGEQADPRALARLGLKSVRIINTEETPNTATLYFTNRRGMRFATSMGGKATGWHADIQVVDDPTNPSLLKRGGEQARTVLEDTILVWKGTFGTRKADPKKFVRVVVMQRLHEMDLAGYEIEHDPSYVKVILPMEYDPERPFKSQWGEDPRRVKGELLWPARFDAEAVRVTRFDLGPQNAAAQLDQLPSPEAGSVFQLAWTTNRWKVLPAGGEFIQSWDMSFQDGDENDYVAGHVWYRAGGRFYLVDRVHEKMAFPTAVQAVKDMSQCWPEARVKLVEEKANGAAICSVLENEIPGMRRVVPLGSKEARAKAASRYWEAGNVWLPDHQDWVPAMVKSFLGFPTAAHDDDVDAASQALLFWELDGRDGKTLAAALIKLKQARSLQKSGRLIK